MTGKRELIFWQRHRDCGSLILAIRSQPKRAIRFFGSFAVYGQNELDLHRTIESHEIVTASDEDLLKELNRVPDLMASEVELSESPEIRKRFIELTRPTMKDVAGLKRQAQQQLNRIHGTY